VGAGVVGGLGLVRSLSSLLLRGVVAKAETGLERGGILGFRLRLLLGLDLDLRGMLMMLVATKKTVIMTLSRLRIRFRRFRRHRREGWRLRGGVIRRRGIQACLLVG